MPHEIVGRGVELAAADRLIERAWRSLAALVLEGEAGIGKTTIWRAAVEAARSRDWTVLTSAPARAEQGLTLGGLSDILDGVGEGPLAVLPEPQRHALDVALLRVAPSGDLPDQRAVSVAVTGLLRSLATSERPVLLALDDAQWLDESSASILAYALRRLHDRPIGVVVSVRSGSASAASDAILDALPVDRVARLTVGPLPLGSLHHLFEQRLGRSFPRLTLVRIEAASGGNPLYALEIARAIERSGVPVSAGDPLPIPESLASLMARRIRRLPPRTRQALLLVAAAGEPTVEVLTAAGVRTVDLAPAVADGVLAHDGRIARFTHPLLSQAALSLADPSALRSAHRALAEASDSPDARARHLGQAADAPDEAVAAALDEAAGEARNRGATLDAARLYGEAARLTPTEDHARRVLRQVRAAESLFVDLGEVVEADAVLEAAIAAATPGPARAEALSLRAIIRYYHGRAPEGIELGERALEELGEAAGEDAVVAALRAKVLGRLAYLVMQLDLARGLELIDEAVAILEGLPCTPDPDVLANALLLRAVGELAFVRPMRVGEVERGLRLMTAAGRSWERDGAAGSEFGLARHTDRLDRAIELARGMLRARSGPGGDDPFEQVQLSGLLVLRGEWGEARQLAEAAMDGYRREGGDVNPAWGLRGLALVAAHDGRLDDAQRWAEAGLAQAIDRGDVIVALFHRHILGFVALSREAWADADTHLAEAWAMADRISTRHPGRFKLAGDLVETGLSLGDVERAAVIVDRLDEAAALAPTPWVLAVGGRCAALLAAARGDPDRALQLFGQALAAHDDLPMPFERARTLLAAGRLYRRRREKARADASLRAALACFEALGSPVWAERARAELGRVGLRPRASAGLTDTERLVAELAASGLSNSRIAERAFLAPKTVGNVLGRVYEKLDIHSRAELGARMAGGATDDRL